ncbi:hypothetical protein BU005_11110 [Mammaliicoccus sciuri]|uniref:LysE family translocator n=1 Tax=Mammaliicoccus sciuri TaxID=1296 RepID=UPI000E67715D|nr:hypothetical protein [Mammaliicoccus sciuri]MCE5058149.1 hypothetical protein [Mammaliicoccus sciuri]RIN88157.1 hypothetical protein BU005_11110 [Mammaliicoccus sciuri]RIN91303.1 hypothetical protein BU003_05975 [Mammaliicoccus sciuri]
MSTLSFLFYCFMITFTPGPTNIVILTTTQNYGNFTSGFVMQFLNPKVVLFCLTVLPSFVLKEDSTFNDVFLNVTIITIIGFLAFASWLLFGTVLKKFIDQHLKVFNVIMSMALVMATLLIWL